jgi:hypothetical protein
MIKPRSRLLAMAVFSTLFFSASIALAKSACMSCHEKVTPGIVKQFLSGKMGKAGLDCTVCHGSKHEKGAEDSFLATIPTPETCGKCHAERVAQYKAGKHSLAWSAMKSIPMLQHQTGILVGVGYSNKGCLGCHKIGLKSPDEIKEYRYGSGACDSCHTRHTFSKEEARDPRACESCHMGFDHPQWEMWSSSKHGVIWQIEGNKTERAPVCQTCHMPNGDHAVMTSWGFLGVRLFEEDLEWVKDRTTILQALGMLDQKGNPTERLETVKTGKMARLTKDDFNKQRFRMLDICSKCHSSSYASSQLIAGDRLIKEADRDMADAITTVKGLYQDGLLKKPTDWKMAPDLLQYYEARSPIEQDLYLMFFEYRMRAFQGAFHQNADYSHWYGWAPMKETLQRIKDDAARLRSEHKRKED